MRALRDIFKSWGLLLGILTLLNSVNEINSKEVFHGSASAINKLVKTEDEIVKAVQNYVSSMERRVLLAKRYLEDFYRDEDKIESFPNRSSSTASVYKDTTPSDPLRLFRLIRRFASTLPQMEKEFHQEHDRKFLKVLENARGKANLPQQRDLNFATEGILRVQDAYDLNVFKFTQGDFDGFMGNSSLNAADCYLIGSYALDASIYTRAVEWLERSYYLSVHDDHSIPAQTVFRKLTNAVQQHNLAWRSSERSPYVYREVINVEELSNSEAEKKRSKVLDKQNQQLYATQSSFMDLTNFATLCRGIQLQEPLRQRKFKCFLSRRDIHNVIAPLKVEVLHDDPRVVQIYDVLPESLTKNVVKHAEKSLARSKVHGTKAQSHKHVSASRTSTSTWIHEPKILKKLLKVYLRLETVLGVNLQLPGAREDFQVSSYGTTGHYNPHLDNILTSDIAAGMSSEELEKGDRLATLMFYLSDVEKGGYSVFPRIGAVAKPVKGSAVFWYNMKRNGDIEPLSLHGGCPLIYGNKWIANQWIRANSQMFTRKCATKRRL